MAELLLAAPDAARGHPHIVLTQVAATGHILAGRAGQAFKVLSTEVRKMPVAQHDQAWVRLLWFNALLSRRVSTPAR